VRSRPAKPDFRSTLTPGPALVPVREFGAHSPNRAHTTSIQHEQCIHNGTRLAQCTHRQRHCIQSAAVPAL
jgi:hypothetical protein